MVLHTHPAKRYGVEAFVHNHEAGHVVHSHSSGQARYYGTSWRRCPECGGVLVEDACSHGAPIVGNSSDFVYEAWRDK